MTLFNENLLARADEVIERPALLRLLTAAHGTIRHQEMSDFESAKQFKADIDRAALTYRFMSTRPRLVIRELVKFLEDQPLEDYSDRISICRRQG
jgi:hypothetical protein